jgi:hypothetical protein
MQTVEGLVSEFGQKIANLCSALLNQDLRMRMTAQTPQQITVPPETPKTAKRRRRRNGMTTWAADSRAKRVPTFVVQATGGLQTKKDILARFGPLARFEKGKALPPQLTAKQRANLAAGAPAAVN